MPIDVIPKRNERKIIVSEQEIMNLFRFALEHHLPCLSHRFRGYKSNNVIGFRKHAKNHNYEVIVGQSLQNMKWFNSTDNTDESECSSHVKKSSQNCSAYCLGNYHTSCTIDGTYTIDGVSIWETMEKFELSNIHLTGWHRKTQEEVIKLAYDLKSNEGFCAIHIAFDDDDVKYHQPIIIPLSACRTVDGRYNVTRELVEKYRIPVRVQNSSPIYTSYINPMCDEHHYSDDGYDWSEHYETETKTINKNQVTIELPAIGTLLKYLDPSSSDYTGKIDDKTVVPRLSICVSHQSYRLNGWYNILVGKYEKLSVIDKDVLAPYVDVKGYL